MPNWNWKIVALTIVLIGILLTWKCWPVRERPECPITDDLIVVDSLSDPGAPATPIHEVPLAGAITHVPEFHDCQRFLVRGQNDGPAMYGGMYAVFASWQLATLADTLRGSSTLPVTPARSGGGVLADSAHNIPDAGIPDFIQTVTTSGGTRALSFVEIYAWDGQYHPLGIWPGFNCLYLKKTAAGQWQAFLAAVKKETTCLHPLPEAVLAGEVRHVRELMVDAQPANAAAGDAMLTGIDVPPVARWDWDEDYGEQLVGVRCGDEWCNVGRNRHPRFKTVPTIGAFKPVDGFAASTSELTRVDGPRGWFDYQRLALHRNGNLRPSDVYGWIFPNPVLYRIRDVAVFEHDWVHAATAYFTADYENGAVKFRPGENYIEMCHDTGGGTENCTGVPDHVKRKLECESSGTPGEVVSDAWYARISQPGGDGYQWRRVCGRDHSGMTMPDGSPAPEIPGTSRWRWLARDETTWNRCVTGCCEVQ